MKVFIDTNVFIEYIEHRLQYAYVRQIFNALEDREIDGVLSQGSYYTITYAIEMGLKRMGVHNPEKRERVRNALDVVLNLASVVGMPHESFASAIKNRNFNDIEDCFQYMCAIDNSCDVLLTINIKNFRGADNDTLRIMTPEQFVQEFL